MNTSTAPALWKLILLSSMAPFFILFPQEALPQIRTAFHLGINSAELAITALLLGYGVGALMHAPIANRFGRKSAMITGFILSLIGIVLSIVSIPFHTFSLMLIGRIITGVGSGAGLVISMVMMNETHSAQRAQQLFALVVPFFAFAPAIGLALGGMLISALSLVWLFIIMGILSILAIMVIISLQETLAKDDRIKINPWIIITHYLGEFKNIRFIFLMLLLTVGQSSMYIFNTGSSIVARTVLHEPIFIYGDLALIPSCGLIIGAILSYTLEKKLGIKTMLLSAILLIFIVAIIMTVLLNFIPANIWLLLLPATSIFIGATIIIPITAMRSLQVSSNPAVASSIINACSLILTSLYVSLMTSLHFLGAFLIPVAIIILCLIALISLVII